MTDFLRRKTNQNAFTKYVNKQKDAKNETEYEESLVTNDVPSYFNVFGCGRNILNRLDMSYGQACMVAPRDEYYTKMLETLIGHNDCHNAPLSSEKILESVSGVMAETEEE